MFYSCFYNLIYKLLFLFIREEIYLHLEGFKNAKGPRGQKHAQQIRKDL